MQEPLHLKTGASGWLPPPITSIMPVGDVTDADWKTANRQLATHRGVLTRRINEGEKVITKMRSKMDTVDGGLNEFTDLNAISKAIAEVLRKVEDKGAELESMCQGGTELSTLKSGIDNDISRADTARDNIVNATEDYLKKQIIVNVNVRRVGRV